MVVKPLPNPLANRVLSIAHDRFGTSTQSDLGQGDHDWWCSGDLDAQVIRVDVDGIDQILHQGPALSVGGMFPDGFEVEAREEFRHLVESLCRLHFLKCPILQAGCLVLQRCNLCVESLLLGCERRALEGARRSRDCHLRVGFVVQRVASPLRTRRPDAGRGRGRLPSKISARRGMRNPNRKASVKPRPVHSSTSPPTREEPGPFTANCPM